MVSKDWTERENYLSFLRQVRDDNPPPIPLKQVAAEAVRRFEERAQQGLQTPADYEWLSSQEQRKIDSVYEELRTLERLREQVYTKATKRADANTIVLAGTQGLRNPTTGAHERVPTKTINREQFRRWRARQLVLFATEAEKLRWSDEVSAFWDKNPELPTLEAVCAAAGIPFEPALAAEMA
jgi:hypothetical protein